MDDRRGAAGAIVGALIAVVSAMGFGRFAYTQLLPPMVAQLHLSPLDAAWIASANFVGYLAGAPAATFLCARLNERRVVVVALIALALTLAATALWGTLPWLVFTRLLAGVESAVVFVSVGILVFETMPRTLAMIAFGGVGVGIFVSAALLAPLASHGPWQRGWLAMGIAAALAAMIARRAIPRIQSRVVAGISIPPGRGLRLVDASYFLQGIGYIVFATFAVLYLVERGQTHAVASGAWLAVGAGAAFGPWLSGVVASRTGPQAALVGFQLVEAAATLVFALAPAPLAIVAALVFGACFPTAAPLNAALYVDLAPCAGARGFGWLTFVFSIGQIAGPLIAGPIAQRTGDFRLPLVLSALALVAAALLAAAVPRAAGPPRGPCETSTAS